MGRLDYLVVGGDGPAAVAAAVAPAVAAAVAASVAAAFAAAVLDPSSVAPAAAVGSCPASMEILELVLHIPDVCSG